MRFYKHKQAEMLNMASYFLKENEAKLASKVPALKEFIREFLEMEKIVLSIRIGNPGLIQIKTGEKQIIRREFVKQVRKLIAVLRASGYKYKDKPLKEMQYSLSELN